MRCVATKDATGKFGPVKACGREVKAGKRRCKKHQIIYESLASKKKIQGKREKEKKRKMDKPYTWDERRKKHLAIDRALVRLRQLITVARGDIKLVLEAEKALTELHNESSLITETTARPTMIWEKEYKE
jgi:hypothetical protein